MLQADVDERRVVIDGAGTLGRRIAAVYVAGGSDVPRRTQSHAADRSGWQLERFRATVRD
jgi:3-hydroxyacyl-CoA dehydrogenase